MRRGLDQRPAPPGVLDQLHLDSDLGTDLQPDEGNFPIAHGAVHIPQSQQRTRHLHRQIDLAALGNVFIVHVATVRPGQAGAHPLPLRCGADNPHHGMGREVNFFVEMHRIAPDLNDPGGKVRRHMAQQPLAGLDRQKTLFGQLDALDLHAQTVPGCGTPHPHRTRRRIGSHWVRMFQQILVF